MVIFVFDVAIVIALIMLSLLAHVPIAQERKIMPAGDVFNFQHITEGIMRLTYPLNEKRLPGYPLLILLTRPFPIDPIATGLLNKLWLLIFKLYGRTDTTIFTKNILAVAKR